MVLESTQRLGQVPLPRWRTSAQVAGTEREVLSEALSKESTDHAVLVAHAHDGRFAGFVYVHELMDYFTENRHGHVSMLVVTAGGEGRGAGASLMRAAEDWAREHSLHLLTLNVFSANERARALYERLGHAPETVKYVKVL